MRTLYSVKYCNVDKCYILIAEYSKNNCDSDRHYVDSNNCSDIISQMKKYKCVNVYR